MTSRTTNRRQFLELTARTSALAAVPYFASNVNTFAQENKAANDKLNVAAIGNGGRGSAVGNQAGRLGNMVACCDVDSQRAEAVGPLAEDAQRVPVAEAAAERRVADVPLPAAAQQRVRDAFDHGRAGRRREILGSSSYRRANIPLFAEPTS